MHKNHKVYWVSCSLFPIGIVKTPSGRTYIGSAVGENEEEDLKFIAEHGTPIDLHDVIKELEIKKDEKECEKEMLKMN